MLQQIPVETIDVVDGHNPRGTIDADALQPLVDSIGAYGVLQPIIVQPASGGRFTVVAGERRFRAAELAGLTEIPAVVRDLNGDAYSVAIVENLQREQLSPLEEARAFQHACNTGMNPGELAAAINVSEQLVRDRLALLKLPESVQTKIDSRELTLAAAKNLQALADAGPAVIEKVVELFDADYGSGYYGDPITPRDLERDPAMVLEAALDELEPDAVPFLASVDARAAFLSQRLAWPDAADIAAVKKKAALLPEYEHAPRYRRPRTEAQAFTDDDLDAATAYGCILKLPSRGGDFGIWITDPVWLADRLAQKLDQSIETRAKKSAKTKSPATASDAQKAEREAARNARQREQTKMLASRDRNLRLGRELQKKLRAPAAISVDGMRAIAELLLAYAGDDLGRCGLRFIDEASQTETRRKDGSLSKVVHLRSTTDCRNLVERFVDGAETAEEIYGALVQLIIATQYADANAAPSSDRFGELRGVRYSGRAKGLTAAIDNAAKAILPDDLRKKVTRRR